MKNNKKGLVKRSAAVRASAVCNCEQHILWQQTLTETFQKPYIFHSPARGSEVGHNGNITYQKNEGI